MCQYRHALRLLSGSRSATALVAAISPLALLLPAAVIAADSAAAAPAPGYTASLIPTGATAYSVAVDAVTGTAYFSDIATNQVSIVDTATNVVNTPIPLSGSPRGIAVDPKTNTIYVALLSSTATSSPAVDVIDGTTRTVTHTIPLPLSSNPMGIAVDSSTDTVYVAEETAAAVAVIDGSSNSVTTTVSTGSGTSPGSLAVNETSGVVWVGDIRGSVLAISGATNLPSVSQTISLSGVAVEDVAVNPATGTVYAATPSHGVAVIDPAAATFSYITGPTPYAVAVDPASGTVFASSYTGLTGTTWAIDASSNAVVDTIARGGLHIAVNTGTGSAYAAPYLAQKNAAWVLAPSAANAMSPVIKSTVATLVAGRAASFTISGSALPAATYSETGVLPAGMTLSSSGVLSGTPATGSGGVYPITLTASNGVAPDYSGAFTLTIDEAPLITVPSTIAAQVGTAVSIPVQVTGGYPGTASAVTASNLPTWLTLTEQAPGSWLLAGTPPVGSAGAYNVSISATNGVVTGTVTVVITVSGAPSMPSTGSATFLTGTGNSYSVSANCYPACSFTESGRLPSGVQLSSAGVLSGSPPAAAVGIYQFTITATNSLGTATQAFTLIVVPPGPAVAVGAEGTDGQLWVQAPQLGTGWHPLGGHIVGPPAVAAPPNFNGLTPTVSAIPVSPLFVATGTDKHLYIRSLTAGWQRISPLASCLGSPAAVITGTAPNYALTVACEGTNHALYYNTAIVPSTGLPQFTSGWTSLGGVLTAGPAVAETEGDQTFFVRGISGRIYTRTLTSGYTAQPWTCTGPPAAFRYWTPGTYFACAGTDHQLYAAVNFGMGWSAAVPHGGYLIGSVAIGGTTQVIFFLGEGSTHAVYERTAYVGWSSLGGSVIGGVGAAALN